MLELGSVYRAASVLPITLANANRARNRVEGPERVYANYTGVHGGAFDVALDFGYQAGDAEAETLVRVAMSWEHAVAVVALLQRQIDMYQERVGRLPDLDGIRDDQADRQERDDRNDS